METKTMGRPALGQGLALVIKSLQTSGPLAHADQMAVSGLADAATVTSKGVDIACGEGPQFVLQGWGCQARTVYGGNQIFSLFVPGDVIPRRCEDAGPAHYRVLALTNLVTAQASPLLERHGGDWSHPNLRRAIRLAVHRHEVRLFDNMVRLGRQDAYQRICHLFIELHARLTAVGIAQGRRFPFPVGQNRIGEMLGLSELHVNRTLQRMKMDGQLLAGPGWYALPHLDSLAAQLDRGPRAGAAMVGGEGFEPPTFSV
jgi:CRP-like cAMP-binding protein